MKKVEDAMWNEKFYNEEKKNSELIIGVVAASKGILVTKEN